MCLSLRVHLRVTIFVWSSSLQVIQAMQRQQQQRQQQQQQQQQAHGQAPATPAQQQQQQMPHQGYAQQQQQQQQMPHQDYAQQQQQRLLALASAAPPAGIELPKALNLALDVLKGLSLEVGLLLHLSSPNSNVCTFVSMCACACGYVSQRVLIRAATGCSTSTAVALAGTRKLWCNCAASWL